MCAPSTISSWVPSCDFMYCLWASSRKIWFNFCCLAERWLQKKITSENTSHTLCKNCTWRKHVVFNKIEPAFETKCSPKQILIQVELYPTPKCSLSEGLETYLFFTKIKRVFSTVHGPGPDGPNASLCYGRLRVQKSNSLVLNDVTSPGQSFHVWHWLKRLLPPPHNRR